MSTFDNYDWCRIKYVLYKTMITRHMTIPKQEQEPLFDRITEEIVADWHRTSQKHLSRKQPVLLSKTDRLDATQPAAKIYLIDSASREGLAKLPPITIHGIQFRTYIPEKPEARSVKSHEIDITKHLRASNSWEPGEEQNLLRTKQLLSTKFNDEGMVINPPDYAPTICLAYANMNTSEKMVFMLRPPRYMPPLMYRLYCGAVLYLIAGANGLTNTHKITEEQAGNAIVHDVLIAKQTSWSQIVCKTVVPILPATWAIFATTETQL